MCDLGVSVRDRDVQAAVTAALGTVDAMGDSRGAPILFRGLSIVGLPRHLGLRQMWRMVLCPGSGRSGQGPGVLSGPRTAIWMNEAAFDGGISTVPDER